MFEEINTSVGALAVKTSTEGSGRNLEGKEFVKYFLQTFKRTLSGGIRRIKTAAVPRNGENPLKSRCKIQLVH